MLSFTVIQTSYTPTGPNTVAEWNLFKAVTCRSGIRFLPSFDGSQKDKTDHEVEFFWCIDLFNIYGGCMFRQSLVQISFKQ